ncbi:MAG: hypothetical protein V3S01_11265 [Dehalococcoidia bacterium]
MNAPQQQVILDQARHAVDAAIGLGAVASPWWLVYLENGLGLFMLAGGAVLLSFRIYLSVLEIRAKRKP